MSGSKEGFTSGYILIHKAIYEHPLFDREEYSRRDAWGWLIANACYSKSKHYINGRFIELDRGQLSFSIRFMAAKWLWDKAKVERYLCRLKTETMIKTSTETGQLIITICNYSKYQSNETPIETLNETLFETVTRQERDSNETKNNNTNQKQLKLNKDIPIPEWIPEKDFQDWVQSRKTKLTIRAKELAISKLKKLQEMGNDPSEVLQQSILNGYTGLFPVKNPKGGQNGDNRQNSGNGNQTTATETIGRNNESNSPQSKWLAEGDRLAAKYRAQAERERQGKTSENT